MSEQKIRCVTITRMSIQDRLRILLGMPIISIITMDADAEFHTLGYTARLVHARELATKYRQGEIKTLDEFFDFINESK